MSYSMESSTYPTTMLLSMNNVTNWEHNMKNMLTAFPDVGQAIRNKTPYVLIKPTINDLIEDSDIRKYNHQANDPTTLTDASLTNFLKAQAAFKKDDKDRRDEEAKVCRLILSSLSDEAQMHLHSVVAFTKATDDNDSYAMYEIAKDEHSRSSSFAVAQSTFQQLLNIKKTGTFAALIRDLSDHRRKYSAIFDPEDTGTVKIDDMFVMILVNSLPDDEFMFMKESLYAKDLSKSFPKFLDVLQDMQNFDLNKQKATPKLEPTVPAGPTILAATATSSSIPLRVECPLCHKMFNQTLRRDGKKHINCYPCFTEARDADASSAANPTPAQVANAQTSLKKAQAVLLAASVAYKLTDSIIPPPTKQDANYLDHYMQSQHFSLTATTTTTTSSAPSRPTVKPWNPDSGSTYSITDDIKDLHRPKKLPTPIPITGVNGAIIHATHVGSSRFDPRLRVYFVPHSAAKLLSLGALSSLGYSYASGPGRCLTITTPFGRTLCNCVIQPNNTWIFPSYLMSPKTSVRIVKPSPASVALSVPTSALSSTCPLSLHPALESTSAPLVDLYDISNSASDKYL